MGRPIKASAQTSVSRRNQQTKQLTAALVQTPTVWVSDLLPGNAISPEYAMAEPIPLGRAPEPGGIRAFTCEQIANAIVGKVPVAIPQQVAVRRAGWPVREQTVRTALQAFRADIKWHSIDISQPAEFVTRTRDAALAVIAMRPGFDRQTTFIRIRCVDRNECGAFLVLAHVSLPISAAQARTPPRSSSQPLVRPGRKAWLVIAESGMRIVLPVLPLKAGRRGDIVRVFDPAAHKVRLAKVESQNLLGSTMDGGK